MRKIAILTAAVLLSLIPCAKAISSDLQVSTCTTTIKEDNTFTVSSRGAVSVPLEEGIYKEPEPILDRYYIPWAEKWITLDEFKLIAKTVQCEAGNQSMECQRLVAVCIINRLCDSKFPDTVEGVIYAEGAFEVTTLDRWATSTYDDDSELATFYAIATYSFEPRDLFYFRDTHYHNFGEHYTYDGDMYFTTED